ncbi:MAG: hypothetical protein HBSAPP03_08260 [Phycisphaerae bacterium]|nr:MAG: hypothetical protein HBSAPP03_08260 [Phycisphaerae bacterium]
MFNSTWGRAVIMSAGVMSAAAVAQPSYHASWSKVELGAWTLTPVYSEEGGAVLSVDGFLALADPSTRLGDNIVAVWYERTAEGWSAKSWGTDDPWKAIATVKELMGIGDAEDERWDAPSMGDPDAVPAVPEEYVVGVLADDPLAALIAASPERDSIILTMVALGYPAADVPVDAQDECSLAAKMDGLAAASLDLLQGDEATAVHRAMQTWLTHPVSACVSMSGTNFLGKFTTTQIGAWTVPLYDCEQMLRPVRLTVDDWELRWCRRERWTDSRTTTETRTRTCRNWLPPSVTIITQTRTCTLKRQMICHVCPLDGTTGPIPCPPTTPAPPRPTIPPPVAIPPSECSEFLWPKSCTDWAPGCP